MDKLETIFELQEKLNQRIGVNNQNLTEAEQISWILDYSRALQQELAELVDSVPWKWWKKNQHFNRDNAKMEVIDIFHFTISLAQVLGLSADDFFDMYLKKNQINHERQDSKY